MPGSIKIKIISARNLPIMDRSTFLTDAFVEIRFSNECFKTDVVKKSLNPNWNSEWITFEMDDQQLQEDTLQIRVLDHDTYSAHDSIGRVYIDLNTLLVRRKNRSLSGWFPIYDTMHGIRGELNLILKLDLFSDVSKFRQSSVGVKFFYSNCVPFGHAIVNLFGFVEELVMMDDPEHQWREKLRTSRASNETRQRLFSKLSGELQRKMGVKVLEMGGNSVIGYKLQFDLEGETGVVIRGIGTVAELSELNLPESSSPPASPSVFFDNKPNFSTNTFDGKTLNPIKESDEISNKLNIQSISTNFKQKVLDFGEFPFLTISLPPPGFISNFGTVVSVKSVKLIEKNQTEEQECRDAWWLELRAEIASHMRSTNCNVVLGYSENCVIYEDVCILIGCGTAVSLNGSFNSLNSEFKYEKENQLSPEMQIFLKSVPSNSHLSLDIKLARQCFPNHGFYKYRCQLCHLPDNVEMYSNCTTIMCRVCGQSPVPEVIFSTSEIPEELEIKGSPTLIQARVCRPKKDSKGEICAKEINDILPFLEYEMHYKLIQNISMKGLNALFGLKVELCVGQNVVIAIGTGTGVFLVGLPAPVMPKINCLISSENELLMSRMKEFRIASVKHLNLNVINDEYCNSPETVSNNNAHIRNINRHSEIFKRPSLSDNVFIDTGELNIDYINSVIKESLPPSDIIIETINYYQWEHVDKSPQMIFRFVRSGLLLNNSEEILSSFGSVTSDKLDVLMKDFNATLWIKLLKLMPCFVTGVEYTFNVTDDNGFEVMCTGFVSSNKLLSKIKKDRTDTGKNKTEAKNPKLENFNLESLSESGDSQQSRFLISPLSFVYGYTIDSYLGCLNFFFVRETTSLREFGGVSGFIQASLGEVQAVVASHTIAAGGSALLSCHVTELILNYPSNGRQMNSAQCLINICGDMVLGHFVSVNS